MKKNAPFLYEQHLYTSLSLSLIIDDIRNNTLMRIIPRRADDLHLVPRDNSIQDGNSILESTSPSFLHGVFRLVTRFCDTHGTWNDIIGIGRVGWVATMAYIYNWRVARMWKLGCWEGSSCTKEDGNNFGRGGVEARIDLELSSTRWDRGQSVHTSTFLGILHLLAFKNTNRTKQLLTLARCSLRPCYSTSNLSASTKFPLLSLRSLVSLEFYSFENREILEFLEKWIVEEKFVHSLTSEINMIHSSKRIRP